LLKVRVGIAGMADDARNALDARRSEAALELVGEQHVRELALAVGGPLVVRLLALAIGAARHAVEVDRAVLVERARLGDDARLALGVTELVEQQAREREVAQMVDAELRLETVRSFAVRD